MENTAGELVIWILVTDSEQVWVYIRKKRKAGAHVENTAHDRGNWVWEPVPIQPGLQLASSAACKKKHPKDIAIKAVATYLNHARVKHLFHRLVLIGPPRLLSALRKHLTRTVRLSIIAEQEKELASCAQEEIARHLPDLS
jgi:protein required for attachment to host cells